MFDFNKEVVEASFEQAVLIDFWAPWCGPCKVLGPLLEEMEKEARGTWKLVKINTEVEQQIASYFKITSIPHCKLVYAGKIIDEFTGALTKVEIERFIREAFVKGDIPAKEIEEEEEEPIASESFESIIVEQHHIPDPQLIKRLEQFLIEKSNHMPAIKALANHEVFYFADQAIGRLLEYKDQKEVAAQLEDLQIIQSFLQDPLKGKSKAASLLKSAREKLIKQDSESAVTDIISAVNLDKHYNEDLPRKLGIALFHMYGSQHPLTQEYRKLFDMAIY